MTLYKYVIPERIDILERLRVRFTHPSALNDLLELRPAFGSLLTPADAQRHLAENPLDLTKLARGAFESLPLDLQQVMSLAEVEQLTREKVASDEGKLAVEGFAQRSLAMMNSFTPDLRTLMYEKFDQLVGVFSLSESWDNGPMWSHYAANSTGLAIGFDETHQFFNRRRTPNDNFYHLRKVVYADQPGAPRSFSDIKEFASIFVTKDNHWTYEQEWRMLAPLTDATVTMGTEPDPIHLFQIPPTAVRCVIFGARADADLVRKVQKLVASPDSPLLHVNLLRVAPDDERGGLKLTELGGARAS